MIGHSSGFVGAGSVPGRRSPSAGFDHMIPSQGGGSPRYLQDGNSTNNSGYQRHTC